MFSTILGATGLLNKLYIGIGVICIVLLGLYIFHFKPLADLEDKVADKEVTIQLTKDAVIKKNAEVKPFEELWKNIKIIEKPDMEGGKNETQTEINVSSGEHSITI